VNAAQLRELLLDVGRALGRQTPEVRVERVVGRGPVVVADYYRDAEGRPAACYGRGGTLGAAMAACRVARGDR